MDVGKKEFSNVKLNDILYFGKFVWVVGHKR